MWYYKENWICKEFGVNDKYMVCLIFEKENVK